MSESDFIKVESLYGFKKFEFPLDSPGNYKRIPAFSNLTQVCGHAFEKGWKFSGSKKLFALFVKADEVFFKSDNEIFNVSSEGWSAERKKISCFKYEFILLNDGKKACSTTYWDIPPSDDDDSDPHFFVNVIQWLKTKDTKSGFVKYWNTSKKSGITLNG